METKERDELLDDVIAALKRDKVISSRIIQRRLKLGYNRAYRIMSQLSEEGFIKTYNMPGEYEYTPKTEPESLPVQDFINRYATGNQQQALYILYEGHLQRPATAFKHSLMEEMKWNEREWDLNMQLAQPATQTPAP